MMNQIPRSAEMEKLQCAIQAVSRMNFYLWMYLAQEGIFEEAHDFIRGKLEEPLPFEAMLGIHPWVDSGTAESPFDPF
jgi:hypothetical protein